MAIFNPFYNGLYGIGYSEPIFPLLTHMPIGLVLKALVLRGPGFGRAHGPRGREKAL